MNTLSTRTACVRMAILLASVCALDAAVVAFTRQPLVWARWIPGLIPILAPLTVWELFRNSSKAAK